MSQLGMKRDVHVEDHSEGLETMKDALEFDPAKTAVLTVDMHRGHLDMTNATMPALPDEATRVLDGASDFLKFARDHDIKVYHAVLTMREKEIADSMNPRHAVGGVTFSENTVQSEAQKEGILHNVEGSVQTEVMPELDVQPTDFMVTNKKTLSCFIGTELEWSLKRNGIDTLLIMGVNTNTCCQNAAFDGFNFGYKVIMMSDCVSSMYGLDLHQFAMENVARCLGWVLTNDEVKEKVLDFEHRHHNAPNN
ncbi:MAG TPA: cysteine hydrolase [Rhodospirillales bacterium]|jgi:nicotinamidase-related amidase|nr:cysteine hydrolase [Rhodospirillales bacterium]HIM20462.1 cysteine hydrolase [Rhodospirillales bacterium]|tara:strand:- start:1009 stop:1761 length:753 start_codon:yes stop_codon:yes gene_type:complete